MEICLLCLELRHESVEFIKVETIQLPDESVEEMIERHLWPMESISSNSWLCKCCWQTLYEFHKFYARIEEAHEDLANMLDSLDEPLEKQDTVNNGQSSAGENFNTPLEEPFSFAGSNVVQLPLHNNNEINTVNDMNGHLITVESSSYQEGEPLQHIENHLDVQVPGTLFNNQDYQPVDNSCPKDAREQTFLPLDEAINDEAKDLAELSHSEIPIGGEILCSSEQSPNDNIDDPLDRSTIFEDLVLKTGEKAHDPQEVHASPGFELMSDNSNDTESDTNGSENSMDVINKVKSFNSYSKLPKNKRDEDDRVIAENVKLRCEICREKTKSFHELRCHYKYHHDQPGYIKCCDKTFKRRNLLADHVRWHLDPEYFKCQHCGKLLAERRCLELHFLNVHKYAGKRYVCDICGNGFGDSGVLKNHKTTHLSQEEKKFPCIQCGKKYGSKHLLANHIRAVHLKKYIKICNICGKKFYVRAKFDRHMLEHEGVPLPTIDCNVCGFKSVSEAGMKSHKETQHPDGGKLEYKCHLCPKISPSIRAHKVHVRYKHELSNNFKCTVCSKGFKRAYTLKEHMATHTNTDLYKCPHCPVTFKSNANMHKHRKAMHLAEWENARRMKFSGFLPPTNQKRATY